MPSGTFGLLSRSKVLVIRIGFGYGSWVADRVHPESEGDFIVHVDNLAIAVGDNLVRNHLLPPFSLKGEHILLPGHSMCNSLFMIT